jgi:hypothetical protein
MRRSSSFDVALDEVFHRHGPHLVELIKQHRVDGPDVAARDGHIEARPRLAGAVLDSMNRVVGTLVRVAA